MTTAELAKHRERQMLKARKRRIGEWEWTGKCTHKCKLNPVQLESLSSFVEEMFREGDSDAEISERLALQGYLVSKTGVGRHRKVHLYRKEWHDADLYQRGGANQDATDQPTAPHVDEPIEPVENIAALRKIIAVGMKKINTGKITPELVVKAIDLEERLTRGTKTNALMDAIKGAFDEDGPEDEVEVELETPLEAAARLSAGDKDD